MATPHSPWRFCVAPMMGLTDRHFRYLFRLAAPSARLYTEMVTTAALIHQGPNRFLQYDPSENPLALQLGGSDPQALAQCAQWAEAAGFAEVNLNVGCPSERVQSGRFGACLMKEPTLVADCWSAMQEAVTIPVTIKTRIGVDECDSDAYFESFMLALAERGCQVFIVHARKAWLSGLSPKENRTVPPLNHERVLAFKAKYPHLTVVLNGGINTISDCALHLEKLDGVMIGRAAYYDLHHFMLTEATLFGGTGFIHRDEWVAAYQPYVARMHAAGVPLKRLHQPLLGLFKGQPGDRARRGNLCALTPAV